MNVVEWTGCGTAYGTAQARASRIGISNEIKVMASDVLVAQAESSFADTRSLHYRIRTLRQWGPQTMARTFRLYHELCLDSLPTTEDYPELAGAVQWWKDFVKAVAASLDLPEGEVLCWLYWRELKPFFCELDPADMETWLADGGELPLKDTCRHERQQDCTAIALPRSIDGRLIGKSCDDAFSWTQAEGFGDKSPTLVVNREQGPSFVSGSGFSVNEAGLAISGAGGARYAENPPVVRFHVPGGVADLVLRHAETTEQAVEMFRRYCFFLPDNSNLALLDQVGSTAVVEPVRVRCGVRWCGSKPAYTTSKGLSDPDLLPRVTGSPQELAYYDGRMARLRWHLDQRPGRLSHRRLREAQCDHDGWAHVCQHGDALPPKEKQPNGELHQMISFVTIHQTVAELDRNRYASYVYTDGKYPCQVEPRWYDYRFEP